MGVGSSHIESLAAMTASFDLGDTTIMLSFWSIEEGLAVWQIDATHSWLGGGMLVSQGSRTLGYSAQHRWRWSCGATDPDEVSN